MRREPSKMAFFGNSFRFAMGSPFIPVQSTGMNGRVVKSGVLVNGKLPQLFEVVRSSHLHLPCLDSFGGTSGNPAK